MVVDTNIWRSTLLLRTSLGPALLYTLDQSGGKLGIPEIVEGEVRKHVVKVGLDAVAMIDRGFREIRAIVGSHRPYTSAGEEEIRAAIEARFSELSAITERVELTLDHTRSAIERINAELPPNGPRNQQFKDSMIWEAVLDLARSYHVHLVSADSGFYRDKERRQMAVELRQECDSLDVEINLYSELDACLRALRAEAPEIDQQRLAQAVGRTIEQVVSDDAVQRDIKVLTLVSHEMSVFVTERHDMLALSFTITFDGNDLVQDPQSPRFDLKIHARGTATYFTRTQEVLDPDVSGIVYEWLDADGEQRSFKSAYGRGHIYLGSGPDVRHSVRHPLHEA